MTKRNLLSTLAALWSTMLLVPSLVQGFVNVNPSHGHTSRPWGLLSTTDGSAIPPTPIANAVRSNSNADDKEHSLFSTEPATSIRAPLTYIGPYPCLALAFPDLATPNQIQKNITGISLDFILDTAANTNTLNLAVAQELGLPVVGAALPGVGSAGVLAGGDTFLLGDAKLQGLPAEEGNFTFMTGLTASALPIASPAAAGLLSLAFLQCFTGGVDFYWGGPSRVEQETSRLPPSITFHADAPNEQVLQGRTRVELHRIPVTQLLSVTVNINGVPVRALLDTGSPVTVMNAQAAKLAGVESVVDPAVANKNNPFAALQSTFQQSQAASRGEILTIMGAGGKRFNLCKSTGKEVDVSMDGSNDEKVQFGSGSVYVGDLPGLAALNGLGVESPPAVVLGMDVLRRRPSMLLRATENEVWF
jgi:hypothetical protein